MTKTTEEGAIALNPNNEEQPDWNESAVEEYQIRLTVPGKYRVIRRNGKLTEFNLKKIELAMTKAFIAAEGGMVASSDRVHEKVANLSEQVATKLFGRLPDGGTFNIEDIQDQVELALMREGEQRVARLYVLYREERNAKRKEEIADEGEAVEKIRVKGLNGKLAPLSKKRLAHFLSVSCEGLEDVDSDLLYSSTIGNLYDQVPELDVLNSSIMATKALIEKDPNYSTVAARLLLRKCEIDSYQKLGLSDSKSVFEYSAKRYDNYFEHYIGYAIEHQLLAPELAEYYDIKALSHELDDKNDFKFNYLGLQNLFDRYFIHHEDSRIELPQAFFMRVAMGLASQEKKAKRQEYAVTFYKMMSSFRFMPSTPTLFNSGTLRPQLSSCYLTTVSDDLSGIYDAVKENALLSKFAGGLGNDWTSVRSMGSHIKGTNGKSQGVVPFLKVANDTAVAVNQGGKRKGAVCAYLETWHLDIEEFLELRKNTGDDRRRTHDMNTANWIPDLFMKRVHEGKDWTLFSPHETSDLHDCYGREFEKRYVQYEKKAETGELSSSKIIPAKDLWRKMLTMLYETGHPWFTFKDPCNIRSPQRHIGVVHSSNLCTEITLNTSAEEIAVCNLGSVNLREHLSEEGLNEKKVAETISIAIRMLDNVIEYNYYSVDKAKHSNLKHRPIGLGLMGFTDLLYHLEIPYDTPQAIDIADSSMELLSYHALNASSELARERGSYESYQGSLWSKGILPIDSLQLLAEERNGYFKLNMSSTQDWDSLRKKIQSQGIRNSNVLAIAPTATIANICGVNASIEPNYQNLYVKSNLSGEFTLINPYLVNDLKKLKMWDEVMISDLKYYDGSLSKIDRIPDELKDLYKTAFEIDQRWLVECAARRQKWIDQSQSLNIYYGDSDAKKLEAIYQLAWIRGLKTTYYLRSKGATHVEKTTLESNRQNVLNQVASDSTAPTKPDSAQSSFSTKQGCSIDDEDCEACQ